MSKKKIDKEKIDNLKKELSRLSEEKQIEVQAFINRITYKSALAKTLKCVLFATILFIILAIIVMSIISSENILKYNPEHFNYFYLSFLWIIFDVGLSFIITGFNKNVNILYKKKSISIGIQTLVLFVLLVILNFIH